MPSQAELQYIYECGVITLRRVRGKYTGDKVADNAALCALLGRSTFSEEEYDAVLFRAGAEPWECGLRVIGDDE